MEQTLLQLTAATGLSVGGLLQIGIGIGVLIAFVSLANAFRADVGTIRMNDISQAKRAKRRDNDLLRFDDIDPKGFMKALIPNDRKQRTEINRSLAMAGFSGRNAVRNFYMVRLLFSVLLPAIFLALVFAADNPSIALWPSLRGWFGGLERMTIFQVLTTLIAIGFFGPDYWLKSRIKERKFRIESAFPNTLDLLQISVEAGLGFDSAMTRVGNEIGEAAPEIAAEFLTVQREIQAGRAREDAMSDMADRMGLEEVRSFVNVVDQSIRYGTNMSDALTTYAVEMRRFRELRAQEKANRLPVQMSAVMAFLMLPALFIISLGPTVLRAMDYFSST